MKNFGRQKTKNPVAARFLFHFLFVGLLLFGVQSCGRLSSNVPEEVQATVERVRQQYAPDARVNLFQIELTKKGDQVIVAGEVIDPKLKKILMDSLHSVAGYYDIIDNVEVLPSAKLWAQTYGIVYVAVGNLRREPKHQSELIDQTPLGTVVRLYKLKNGHYFVQNWDRYLGWLSKASVVATDSLRASLWQKAPHVVVVEDFGVVRSDPDETSEAIVRLVPGALLKKEGVLGKYVRVQTPDGRIGFVKKKWVMDEEDFRKIRPGREAIAKTAKKFLGVPYLWGGASSFGFDCSGFVQTVFRLNNIELPRDANQMEKEGEEINPGKNFKNLKPGDLLFFGPKPNRITHVAISLGKMTYIHSDGQVHINNFDPYSPLYNPYRHETFQKAKRILQE